MDWLIRVDDNAGTRYQPPWSGPPVTVGDGPWDVHLSDLAALAGAIRCDRAAVIGEPPPLSPQTSQIAVTTEGLQPARAVLVVHDTDRVTLAPELPVVAEATGFDEQRTVLF